MQGGQTPYDGHPDQCTAKAIRTRQRCRRWRMLGATKCHIHGGRRELKAAVRIGHLPRFYSKHLSKTLNDAVEEALAYSPQEQISLFEELAITREMAGDALKAWAAAKALPDSNVKKQAYLQASSMLVREVLDHVRTFCESAARIQAMGKDKFSIHNLQAVVNQIVRISYDVFGDDLEKAQQFERAIAEHVRLAEQNQGTLITPDQDVIDMDSTIPREEP
jgi:hypothetical protein